MGNLELVLGKRDALIIVDMQVDFIEGSLKVEGADRIIPAVNRYIELFSDYGCYLFYTRDWHPEDHISFREMGGPWPKHCVAGTEGAAFHPELVMPADNFFIISKGTDPGFDAYSGFQGTCLDALLKERGIRRLFVCGVATDYCVKHTVLGGINLGYQVFVLIDAIKGVDLKEGDSQRALEEMYEAGAVGLEL